MSWPPLYKIKTHRLAKSVKLRLISADELQITVPNRFNLKHIDRILEENKDWIVTQLSARKLLPTTEFKLPQSVVLHGLEELWKISYVACKTKLQVYQRPNFEIVLMGNIQNISLCIKKIIEWIKQYSKPLLLSILKQLSDEIGMPYVSSNIRDQKTLWGSCTSHHSISLNYKLIFMPKSVMRYVMIHELCHTRYLNHSKRFWDLVGKFDLHWQANKLILKRAKEFIPEWIKE